MPEREMPNRKERPEQGQRVSNPRRRQIAQLSNPRRACWVIASRSKCSLWSQHVTKTRIVHDFSRRSSGPSSKHVWFYRGCTGGMPSVTPSPPGRPWSRCRPIRSADECNQKVAGDNSLGMIADERSPVLRRGSGAPGAVQVLRPVLADGTRRNADAQL